MMRLIDPCEDYATLASTLPAIQFLNLSQKIVKFSRNIAFQQTVCPTMVGILGEKVRVGAMKAVQSESSQSDQVAAKRDFLAEILALVYELTETPLNIHQVSRLEADYAEEPDADGLYAPLLEVVR